MQICACTALFFSLVHAVVHLINFYHVATQPLDHLKCLSPELSFSDEKPDIHFWLFRTLTGLTGDAMIRRSMSLTCLKHFLLLSGVMLYAVVCVIFLFAHPLIRKKAYRFFWLSHQLYVLFYILCMLHGLGRITAAPKFWIFFAFPGVVFTCDKVR